MADDHLSLAFAALADPTRRAILERLARGEATVGELAAPFQLRLPTVSKHIKVLERAGLLTQSRRAQWRPCRLEPEPIRELSEWLREYRRLWSEPQQRLDSCLEAMKGEGSPDDREDT